MQTFLPYPDFAACARVLDTRRLGKQRVEALQIVRALLVPDYGWRHHPAVLMWKGHPEALGRYGIEVCGEWRARGFADTCQPKILAHLGLLDVELVRGQEELAAAGALPPWLGDAALHRSHQSALLRKDPEFYGPRFPGVPDDLPYVWPVRSEQSLEAERRRLAAAVRREERAARRAEEAARKQALTRSRAARKGWQTRRRSGSPRS
jgi:Pyrimidine dimer DNA glycosylase